MVDSPKFPVLGQLNANLYTAVKDFADGIKVLNQFTLRCGDYVGGPGLSGVFSSWQMKRNSEIQSMRRFDMLSLALEIEGSISNACSLCELRVVPGDSLRKWNPQYYDYKN